MKASTESTISDPGRSSPAPTQSYVTEPLRLQKILVPVDFSEESLRAIDYAAALAARFHAGLHFAYVYDGEHPFASVTPTHAMLDACEATRCLKTEVERRLGIHHLTPGNCHIRMGRPFREIAATAKQIAADLIIVAAQGHSGRREALLGTTADKIILHAPCPVLVVREGENARRKHATEGVFVQQILVPVDFSECAQEGARYATAFAEEVGADLLLLHAMDPHGFKNLSRLQESSDAVREVQTALIRAEDELDAVINFLPLGELSADAKVVVGVPVDALVEETKRQDIDLVIMSTHGTTGLREALLGSVAEQMVRRAACPVLVVPSHPRKVPN